MTRPVGTTVPRAARRVRSEWDLLCAAGPRPELFDPAMLADLPEPARRWLTHAIEVGTELASSVRLTMSGHIRLGAWRSFTAEQVITPSEGYIWAARASFSGLPVLGFDRLSSGTAEMRWRMLDVLPVVSATGADVLRSAVGRLACEFVMVPTSFRSAVWRLGDRPDTAVATWLVDGEQADVHLEVDSKGHLRSVLLQRWSDAGGTGFGYVPFGVTVEAERTFGGVTIPSTVRAGWWWGTDREDEGEFFRATITGVAFSA